VHFVRCRRAAADRADVNMRKQGGGFGLGAEQLVLQIARRFRPIGAGRTCFKRRRNSVGTAVPRRLSLATSPTFRVVSMSNEIEVVLPGLHFSGRRHSLLSDQNFMLSDHLALVAK
jgi:hypothetical protein